MTFDCADPAASGDVLGGGARATGSTTRPPGSRPGTEALDAWGVPPERRNSASAVHDPDGARPAAVLPAGAGGQGGQEPGAPRRTRRAGSRGRGADGGPGDRVRAAGRAGCGARRAVRARAGSAPATSCCRTPRGTSSASTEPPGQQRRDQQHREHPDDLDREHVGHVRPAVGSGGEHREEAAGRGGEVRREPVDPGHRGQQQRRAGAQATITSDDQRRSPAAAAGRCCAGWPG